MDKSFTICPARQFAIKNGRVATIALTFATLPDLAK
jgi:hypothetical protein